MLPENQADIEAMLKNYDKANRLRAWADLFGFSLEMGRGGEGLYSQDALPYIILDGVANFGPYPESLMKHVAEQMGMDENYLNGVPNEK